MPNKIPVFRPLKAASVKTMAVADRGDDPRQQALWSKEWRLLRKEVIRQWVQEHGPYCADCKRPLTFGRDMHVDHIERHSGIDDPKFRDVANCQLLCLQCHSSKTRREARRVGGVSIPGAKRPIIVA